MSKKTISIYYDGFCPVCTNYVAFQRIRAEFNFNLINIRENPVVAKKYNSQGYNLDTGMLVEINDQIFYGAEAMIMLSSLQNDSILGRFWRYCFKNKRLTKALYPLFLTGRNILLFILRRPKFK